MKKKGEIELFSTAIGGVVCGRGRQQCLPFEGLSRSCNICRSEEIFTAPL
jgi:hypothetical protein